VLGVGRADIRQPLAAALAKLGTRHSVVVHGEDGMGEVTLAGRTDVTDVQNEQTSETTWNPKDFDSDSAPLDKLMAETPAESAAVIRQILNGQPSPAREIVVLNTAAAIWVTGSAADLTDAASRARQAIDDGSARDLLARLVEVSSS
jgi:anthranilate phosphoribosyltransferase